MTSHPPSHPDLDLLARDIARLRGSHRRASTVPIMRAVDIAELLAAARPLLRSEKAFFEWAAEHTGLQERQVKTHLALAKDATRIREQITFIRQSRVEIDPRYYSVKHIARLREVVLAIRGGVPVPDLPDRRKGSAHGEPRLNATMLLQLLIASVEWTEMLEQQVLDAGLSAPSIGAEQRRLLDIARRKVAAASPPDLLEEFTSGMADDPQDAGRDTHDEDDELSAVAVDEGEADADRLLDQQAEV